jgi:hypothetical protein
MFASAYGLTFDEFLSYTPRQIQIISEVLRIRAHNDKAFQAQIHGYKADTKDLEMERMMKGIARKHAASAKPQNHDKIVSDELEKVKNG